ncbi:ribosomal RNA processing protein 1 homolog A-like [Bolinopsis microptera]|uniref:ribosomal RNA processing protein 1 homolog A-like n=1 Tax=Bolinopsis microptera TaxID=2820187 RepID=UPI003079425B
MPADGPAVSDDSHISFAKRLAHNNKDTRESALKKVKRWLVTKSKQGTLDHDEIIKIWKGLHYSMWYSDKPLTQQTLALDISQIVSLLPDIDDGISFFGGFCETIAREWVGIDRHRLDKFYMFIKTALKCVMEFCKENNWDDTIVSNVVDTLDIRIINSQSQCPDSISVFISEHLYPIYSAICNDSTSPLFITEMLLCYVTALSKTPKKDLSRVFMENLFSPIIYKSISFKVDHEQLTSFITTIAIQPDILTRNRKLLYKLRNDIATAGGVDLSSSSPLGKHKLENVNDENVSSNSPDGAEVGDEVKPPKKKKKKKVKQAVEESIADITEENGAESSDTKVEEAAASVSEIVDQGEKETIPVNEPEAESATVEVDQNNTEDVEEAEDEPMETETHVSEPDSVVIPVTEVEFAVPTVVEEAPVVSNGGVEDDSAINDAAVISEQVVDDVKEVVDDTVAREMDNKTSEDGQETVVEDDTKDDSNDTGGDVMAADERKNPWNRQPRKLKNESLPKVRKLQRKHQRSSPWKLLSLLRTKSPQNWNNLQWRMVRKLLYLQTKQVQYHHLQKEQGQQLHFARERRSQSVKHLPLNHPQPPSQIHPQLRRK